jgi:predicted amidohydrolase YtcJ
MSPEEAVRGYSTWAAYASFVEQETGVLAAGRWADVTVMDIDPLNASASRPEDLLKGAIRLTMVAGRVAHEVGR